MKTVTIYSTSKCNIRCKHCGVGNDQEHPRKNQTTEEMKKIMFEISNGGAKFITILGGEATIYRNDLSDLLDYAYEIGLKVSINTNLTSWKPIQVLLNKPALNSFIVSLDGATEETHDIIRGKGTFKKTTDNLKLLSQNERVLNKTLMLEIAFVMTGVNFHESSKMLEIAKIYNATHLNIKNIKLIGRATQFNDLLDFNSNNLLDAYSSLILNWYLSEKTFELEVFIPPSYAEFLNLRFDLNLPTTYHPACGGTNVFSYVDLYGNHLPCPAMSYEEKQDTIYKGKAKEINLINDNISSSFDSDVFKKFESNRENRKYKNNLFPCKFCKYNNQCQQCVAGIISGNEEETVDICKAIFLNGNDYVPNIKSLIWTE